MGLSVKITNDCKSLIIGIAETGNTAGTITITNGSSVYTQNVSASINTSMLIATADVGVKNGVFNVDYSENGSSMFQSAVIGNCDILCCLAKKVDKLIACNADCAKCASELAEAQQIFLLMKSAETELSSMTGGVSNSLAIIENAAKKYNKAAEICGGHCGCNC